MLDRADLVEKIRLIHGILEDKQRQVSWESERDNMREMVRYIGQMTAHEILNMRSHFMRIQSMTPCATWIYFC